MNFSITLNLSFPVEKPVRGTQDCLLRHIFTTFFATFVSIMLESIWFDFNAHTVTLPLQEVPPEL